MRVLHFSPKSLEDLDEILDYIGADNPMAAARFAAAIKSKCLRLAEFPSLGVSRDELKVGLRALPAGNHVVYYTVSREHVRVERVLHGARDRDAIFGPSDAG